jgi:hypothetical protein
LYEGDRDQLVAFVQDCWAAGLEPSVTVHVTDNALALRLNREYPLGR